MKLRNRKKMINTNSYFNFKDIVAINMYILDIFGIIPPKFDGGITIVKYSVRVFILLVVFFAALVASELTNVYYSFGKTNKLIEGSFLTLANILTIVYYTQIFKHRHVFGNIIESINRKEFQPRNDKQLRILESYVQNSKVITLSLQAACTATCLFWAIYGYTASGGPYMPTPGYVPYNTENEIVFNFTFVYAFIAVLLSGVMNTSAEALVAGLIMVICAELKILNDSLMNLRKYAQETIKSKYKTYRQPSAMLQGCMNHKLRELISQHKHILMFSKQISDIFGMAILGHFIVAVLILCTSLFAMTLVPFTSVQFFSYICFLYCMVTEIFIMCYFGNEVISESNNLTNSAYTSDWIGCPLDFKKKMIFFMTRTQMNLQFQAGGVFSLSLANFVVIMKSSISYFTVLYQISNSPRI